MTSTQNGRQACAICRERKVRCDREEPACGRCARLGQDCRYDAQPRIAPGDLPLQLSQIHDRLARAEALLAGARNSPLPALTPQPRPEPASTLSPAKPHQKLAAAAPQQASGEPTSHAPLEFNLAIPDALPAPTMAPDQADYLDLFANFADGMDHSESESFLGRFSMPNPILESSMSPMMPTSPPHTLAFGNQNDRSSLYSLAGLHRNYFDVIYFSLPFLSEDRFTAELAANPNSPALLALSYAVALVGCTITLQHAHLRDAYYATARNYVEQCERSLSEEDLASFNLFQALLFLIRFEIMNRRLTRAWMTLGRAVRLSKLLGLHRMDRDTNEYTSCFDLDLGLPTTQDPLLLEERRRSFWCLYILESYVRTRTGADCELVDTKKLHVFLPSPGLLSPGFSPLKMPFLDDLTPESSHEISSYAGCVLMVELAMKCFDHGRKIESGASTFGFWDTHYNLVHTVDERITMLQRHMNAKAIKEDPVAFGLYMNLRGTEIYFHEASILYVERTGHPRLVAAESQRRSLATAYKIATVVRLNWPDQQSKHDIFMLQATFIAWPLVMAMKALHRELKHYLAQQHQYGEAMTELVTSLRILMKALDYIEEGDGFWHKSTEDIAAVLLGLHDGAGLDSVAL